MGRKAPCCHPNCCKKTATLTVDKGTCLTGLPYAWKLDGLLLLRAHTKRLLSEN
jgi:hypothetical protein